jgi:CheY-like chemotaxis protein
LLSGRRKLLLADDSPTVQKVISLFFEEEGMEVVAVGDGAQALRLLESEPPPDILIADVWMPGPDGYKLCERVKSDERLRHIPVVLLAGRFEPFNEAEARRVGADTVLTKPFQSIRDLISRVGSLLGGGPKREEDDRRAPREEAHADAAHAGAQFAAVQDEEARADSAPPFADYAVDDELIEATPAESFAGAARGAHTSEGWRTVAEPEHYNPEETLETAETFEAARAQDEERAAPEEIEPEEIEVSEHAEEFEAPVHGRDVFAAHQDATQEASVANGQSAVSHEAHAGDRVPAASGYFAARAAGAAAADDALLDLGQFEPPAPAAEADDFILDLEEDLPAPTAAQGFFSQTDEPSVFARTDENVFAQTDEPSAFAEASHGAPASSEVVMQDDPQSFASPTFAEESVAAPRGFVEPSVVPAEEPVPATVEGEYTDGSVEGDVPKPPASAHAAPPAEDLPTAPSEPSPAGYAVGEARAGVEESPRAGQLSREDVDAIARRVVELMSERVVREIAWEVVPELAALMIKRKLEEEGK